jgi:hypothetical protein
MSKRYAAEKAEEDKQIGEQLAQAGALKRGVRATDAGRRGLYLCRRHSSAAAHESRIQELPSAVLDGPWHAAVYEQEALGGAVAQLDIQLRNRK